MERRAVKPRGIAAAAARWLPLAGLCAIWAAHLYWSVSLRPDVMVEDEWHVFTVPGYGRHFSPINIFGTQSDTIAAYQNFLQYIMLITTNLRYPHYIAVQNIFLLMFLLTSWRLVMSLDIGDEGGNSFRSAIVCLLLVPVFTGTHHFLGSAMGFIHQMPMVWLVAALLALRAPVLGALRQPVAGGLLFLSGAAYLSGWMYLLATALALAFARLLAAPEERRSTGLPAWGTIGAVGAALTVAAALSLWLSHRPYLLVEQGTTFMATPLLWPWDGRFWTFYLIAVARGWGLPPGTVWGAVALTATVAPLLALVFRSPGGLRPSASDAFALAAPILGALLALAMITGGRGLAHGVEPEAVEAFARRNSKYMLHVTFALPFVAVAWLRLAASITGASRARLAGARAAIVVLCLAGFAAGGDGPLAERLDFRKIYDEGNAYARDAANCLENAVRLARATGPDVPIRCPASMISSVRGDLRAAIASAERAGVASIAGIPDRPPVSIAGARAAIAAAEAAGAPPAGRIEAFDSGPSWLRLAGRVAAMREGALPRWIAVAVPGRPPWLARVGGTGGRLWTGAGPPDAFDATVPADEAFPLGVARVWALDVGPGGEVAAAVPVGAAAVALRDAPPAGVEAPGGYIDAARWDPGRRELTVEGWALADSGDDGWRMGFHAPGAAALARFETISRPDVVEAHGGDARLLRSGFSATLVFADGSGAPPIARVFSEDRAFGRRVLRGLVERGAVPGPAPGGGEK